MLAVDLLLFKLSGEMTTGDLLVGLGTIALAVFTARLAVQTKADVGLTRESIEAQDMPYVIAAPSPIQLMVSSDFTVDALRIMASGSGGQVLAVRLWNLGKGPAIVTSVTLRVRASDVLLPLAGGIPVAAGAVHDARLDLVPDLMVPTDATVPECELKVNYRHANGSTYTTVSRATVTNGDVKCETFERRSSDEGV